MEELPRDVLFTIALQLDFPDLLLFCKSIPRVNELICSKDYIWIAKLNNEFPNWKDFNINKPYIKIYETISGLKILREKLGLNEKLIDMYNQTGLSLDIQNRTEIPKEIQYMENLESLDMNNNHIREIPKEIGKLVNLKGLYLDSNDIEIIPKEIGNLVKLEEFNLSDNNIIEIPVEIRNLINLEGFWIHGNPLDQKTRKILSSMTGGPNELVISYSNFSDE